MPAVGTKWGIMTCLVCRKKYSKGSSALRFMCQECINLRSNCIVCGAEMPRYSRKKLNSKPVIRRFCSSHCQNTATAQYPEVKRKKAIVSSGVMRNLWKDKRNMMLGILNNMRASESWKTKRSKYMKAKWTEPEFRAKMISIYKARWQDPQYREMIISNVTRSLEAILRGRKKTNIELIMEDALDILGIVHIYNLRVNIYMVDFALPDYMVAIECDGTYWHSSEEQKAKDGKKDKLLISRGWRVARFSEKEILGDIEGALDRKLLPLLSGAPNRCLETLDTQISLPWNVIG